MKKIYNWIVDKRLLDGYIGIMSAVLFFKILADYHGFVYLFDLSARVGKVPIFGIGITHWRRHSWDKDPLPLIQVSLSLWKWKYNSAAKAIKALHERSEISMAQWRKDETEKERLITAAKAAGL